MNVNPGALGFFVWIYGGENVGVGKGSVRGMESWYARGRGYRPGQGLRRGIQLRFREMAKTIAAGPELASGSNS